MESVNTTKTIAVVENDQTNKKVEKKGGKRIGYNYIIIKSLKESRKNDVFKCLYIKSLTNFGFCVIKEGSYGDSKDSLGRDIKDRLKWQKRLHESLQNKVRIPRLLGSFEENGNYYLVMEHIKGKPLYKAYKDNSKDLPDSLFNRNKLGITFLDYLIQIAGIIESLHHSGVVHRDITANNFMITPDNKVAIIDMELSYSLDSQFPDPPFQLGTYGYMSPEQEATRTPTVKEDIFSLGALILQTWTGISPSKLVTTSLEELSGKIEFFIRDKKMAEIVTACLHPDPQERPMLHTITTSLKEYRSGKSNKLPRRQTIQRFFSREQIQATVQQVITTLSSPLLADTEKGWFSENMKSKSAPDKKKIDKAWYASYNRGASGIIYMLSQAAKVGLNITGTLPYVEKGIELIKEKYIDNLDTAYSGLHFGSDGIAACLSTALEYSLIGYSTEYIEWIENLLTKNADSLGILKGTAGQGIANLLIHPAFSTERTGNRLEYYVNELLTKQLKDGSWPADEANVKKETPYGFARGTTGIIYFLLEYGQKKDHKSSLVAAEKGLYWLIKKATLKKQSAQWPHSLNEELSPWWCEGLAGISLAFIKAYDCFKLPIYKTYATGALYNHHPRVIDANLSQCHGLSGLGEVYLEAFRVFNDEEWHNRAGWISQVLMRLKKQHSNHGPYWIVEHEREPVANFMVGNSGLAHFLLRYCYPDNIKFPLSSS